MNAKRWMALFLALTLAITMLAGCTKKTETPVADPEQGQTEQEPEQEETGGFGLFNVNQRIQLNYGREYGLKIQSTYGQGTEIWVRIPCRAEKIKRKRNISKKITPFEENTAKL